MIEKRIISPSRIKAQFEGFLNTPPLWQGTAFGIQQFPMPMPLPDLLNQAEIPPPSHGPLGKRMESFFQYYIQHFSDYQLLAHNLQIQGSSATAGEIDFLLEKKSTAEIAHVELVYKVYLYLPCNKEGLHRWIGPNKKDALVKKLDRLQKHQLPMLHATPTKPILENLGISTNTIQQYSCFKAQLFLPRDMALKASLVNPLCVKGYWITYDEFTSDQYGEFAFFSPIKQDWSIDPSENDQWYDFATILQQVKEFINNQRSPLLWINKGQGAFERMFIVWW